MSIYSTSLRLSEANAVFLALTKVKILKQTGKHLTRSEIARGILNGLERAGVDFGECSSEAAVAELVAKLRPNGNGKRQAHA